MREATASDELRPFTRSRRTVVVVDLVDSVRLIEQDEDGTVARWRSFVAWAADVATRGPGRLVKSLGDGMLLEFDSARVAVQASLSMQRYVAERAGDGSGPAFQLRIGVHSADVIVDDIDIFGTGVNLAARLLTLAGPGEVVVSSTVRDQLVNDLDAEIEDLGDCRLRNLRSPVRAFRVGARGAAPNAERPPAQIGGVKPAVAVLPMRVVAGDVSSAMVGEALADGFTAALAQCEHLIVVSSLSAAAFRDRVVPVSEVGSALRAEYVLSGKAYVLGSRLRLHLELASAADSQIVWAKSVQAALVDVFALQDDLVPVVAQEIAQAIVVREIRRARALPMQSLEACSLTLGAVEQMHCATRQEFERSRRLLGHLIERFPRSATAYAWLAKWYVLRVAQGWSDEPMRDAEEARRQVGFALEFDGFNALALAIDGLVSGYVVKDLDAAGARYAAALRANPNESLAWLFTGTLRSWRGEGGAAAEAADHALRLSPLDPMKYFYDSLAGTAYLAGGDYRRAIDLCRRSLRANRLHTSTYRALAIAQVLSGDVDSARSTVQELRVLEPALTVAAYRERYPGREAPHAAVYCDALRQAGLPP